MRDEFDDFKEQTNVLNVRTDWLVNRRLCGKRVSLRSSECNSPPEKRGAGMRTGLNESEVQRSKESIFSVSQMSNV